MSSPDPEEILSAITALIGAIGLPEFGKRFLAVLQLLSGTEYCSAFAFEGSGPRVVFAEGTHPAILDFAQIASLDYARDYWRRDPVGRAMLADHRTGIAVVRVAAVDIRDMEHRRNCYDRAGVGSRISLCAFESTRILANGYRSVGSGRYSLEEIERVEQHAPVLLAAVSRHFAYTPADAPSQSQTVRNLIRAGRDLSARELQVAAAIAQGKSGPEIADSVGVALSSVITYRRRSYRKLGVTSRRGLVELIQRLEPSG